MKSHRIFKTLAIAAIAFAIAAICGPIGVAQADEGAATAANTSAQVNSGAAIAAGSATQADSGAATTPKAPSQAKAKPARIREGLYELRMDTQSKRVLTVKEPSLKAKANVIVDKRASLNGQKFAIHRVGSYYRICSPLSNLAVSVKAPAKAAGANVRMETYKGKARQLWRAERLADGSIRFINKASKMALAPKSKKRGANVRQAKAKPFDAPRAKIQGFKLVKTKMNLQDRTSYVQVANMASSAGKVTLSNKARGYTVNKRKWKELRAAVRACHFSIGFIMIDCNTGMTVSYSPGGTYFGASTIKGLYTTYLFESELEKGRLSKGRISGLVQPTIVWSNNDTYRSLRWNYGSQSRFNRWLRQVDVGSLGLWPDYSARTLAKAWINMLAYSNSKGKHVGYWKRTFNHSHMSSIHDALGKRRTTYTKPGWMTGGYYGYKLNDGGVVNDRHGRQYVLAIMTSANPYGQKGKVERVVKALDAVHMDMPKVR